ncbi:MAG TPA: glycosyltransferase, partial [Acidimicrobiia bacterium]
MAELARGLYPGLDEAIWNRQRDRQLKSEGIAPTRTTQTTPFRERPPHIVVVPPDGPGRPSWGPGHRNFYYEAAQSAKERWGEQSVSVLEVAAGASADTWQSKLLDLVHDTHATHILTHIEGDPTSAEAWTWDSMWSRLHPTWDGALLGVMFDSAFTWISAKSRRLARMSPQFMVVDICMPMDGVMVRNRPEVGPVNMPVSDQSLALLDARLEGLEGIEPISQVSFIGALYPYRQQLIDSIRSRGIDVAVNPHRPDVTVTFEQSRADQPGWLDYMAGLAASSMTINFSRSSAGEFEQLKTRVIEATLAGTLLLTDDKDRTRLFFEPEVDYAYFPNVDALPDVIESWL